MSMREIHPPGRPASARPDRSSHTPTESRVPSDRICTIAHRVATSWTPQKPGWVLLLPALMVTGCTSSDHIVLSAHSNAVYYTTGESITIEGNLTNQTRSACELPGSFIGGLMITGVTHDGHPVDAVSSSYESEDGIESSIALTVNRVAPNDNVAFSFTSRNDTKPGGAQTFRVDVGNTDSTATSKTWPVDTPGHYTVTLKYSPGNPATIAGRCGNDSNEVSIEFQVDK